MHIGSCTYLNPIDFYFKQIPETEREKDNLKEQQIRPSMLHNKTGREHIFLNGLDTLIPPGWLS